MERNGGFIIVKEKGRDTSLHGSGAEWVETGRDLLSTHGLEAHGAATATCLEFDGHFQSTSTSFLAYTSCSHLRVIRRENFVLLPPALLPSGSAQCRIQGHPKS